MTENMQTPELDKEQKEETNPYKRSQQKTKVRPGGKPAQSAAQEQESDVNAVTETTSPPSPENREEEAVQPVVEPVDPSSVLADRYSATRSDGEGKSVRFSALIKPSLIKKMDADIRNKRIKSRNDLLNFLLEQYYGDDKK